jgi:hypothetical protein
LSAETTRDMYDVIHAHLLLRGLRAARFGELRVPGDLAHFVAVACALFSIE